LRQRKASNVEDAAAACSLATAAVPFHPEMDAHAIANVIITEGIRISCSLITVAAGRAAFGHIGESFGQNSSGQLAHSR
jgi:hypothetical protein